MKTDLVDFFRDTLFSLHCVNNGLTSPVRFVDDVRFIWILQMKTLALVSAILFTAVILSGSDAKAQVLLSEDFSYADGALVPNGGWTEYGNNQPEDLLVESGQALIRHGNATQDVNLSFTTTPGTLYYGIDFSVDDRGTPFDTNFSDFEYFATFYNGNNDTINNLSARLDIVSPSDTGDFTVGIASDDGTADATWGTDLNYGTTYRAIVSYDQADNVARLWIDAAVESDTSIVGTNQDTPGDVVSAFALRQTGSDAEETIRVDNLLVGTSFNDVVIGVPEPGSVAFLIAAGLVGLVSTRRRSDIK